MESQLQPNADIRVVDAEHTELVERFLTDYFASRPTDLLQPFSLEEVSKALSKAKVKKAPGLDDISAR